MKIPVPATDSVAELEAAAAAHAEARCVLRLDVTGTTRHATRALVNIRRFIGDMSQTERILLGLDLRDTTEEPPPPARGR